MVFRCTHIISFYFVESLCSVSLCSTVRVEDVMAQTLKYSHLFTILMNPAFETFLGNNTSYEESKVVIVSMPFEGTVSYGKGTSKGPATIIHASAYLERYDEELDAESYKQVFTLEFLPIAETSEAMTESIYDQTKVLVADDKFTLGLGGEHSVTFGQVKAWKEKYSDLSVLQIDAHTDLRDVYQGSKYSHACVMKRIVDLGCKTVHVGIRSQDKSEVEFLKSEQGKQCKVMYAKDVQGDGRKLREQLEHVLEHLTNNVFITFDVDGLDPSVIRSTGTPEPGGLTWYQALTILKEVFKHKNVVGADVVELAPQGDIACDFTAAKLVYKMMGYKLCKGRL
jgi:agmatinase